ncbi:carboxyl transferase domain-containing protein [Mobilicoccus sp.]|uniref:acetyl-CoA carboxylase family protein n=1 Tax=Mobilicoccus sp. TaxID=2034349 RepID=UPI0028AC6AE9|nr:carboxyl transferase domain-containing protein [Mobilicoccus sp.]
MTHVLVANRGEIAVRILRAVRASGRRGVAVRTADERDAPHARAADVVVDLPGEGPAAYLDVEALIAAAVDAGADLLHPGYGFLSESPELARACERAGVRFVGPSPEALSRLGDKASCRELAESLGLPVARAAHDEAGARELMASLPAGSRVVVKAVAGGGGRGIRFAQSPDDLPAAMAEASSEGRRIFGDGRVVVEEVLDDARHVEVQIAGDGRRVVALGTRDCSLQRRRQKVIETAPALLTPALRDRITDAAEQLVGATEYVGLATVELLVTGDRFVVMEVNPRLQVEHTVTEEVTGLDLVRGLLDLAAGASLEEAHLTPVPERGVALEARINAETVLHTGEAYPSAGTASTVEWPSGPGVRVDTQLRAGVEVTGRFDPLLAKIVVRGGDAEEARRALIDALDETRIDGVRTNVAWLRALLDADDVRSGRARTTTVDTLAAPLAAIVGEGVGAGIGDGGATQDGATGGTDDEGTVRSPMPGVLSGFEVSAGDVVAAGAPVAVVEAMKMEHVLRAPTSGTVLDLLADPGAGVTAGTPLLRLDTHDVDDVESSVDELVDLDAVRDDLRLVTDRHATTLDANRPDAVARRRRTGHRTARENIADLVDPGSLREYGALVVAAQRRRRSVEELREATPADGIVTGLARIGGAPVAVLAYDYTVLAGTQGYLSHHKTDRMLELAREQRLPVVLFAEGGGGRPGDTDTTVVSGLDVETFSTMGSLSGHVPSVGIAAGRCFAGNAALLGCCDVVVATRDASIGMGGPAMIEGGGLGTYRPEEIGPAPMQARNGVVDVLVEDEAEAVAVARRYVDLLTHREVRGEAPDQRRLRHVIPENRKRAYDVGDVVTTLCDVGTPLELRAEFGSSIRTYLARVDGAAVGIVANDPRHLGGAIDADSADKLARFLQLCDAHGLPIVSLCDTPGFMVGPETEATATVRHFSRVFVVGARLRVPVLCVVLRKGYGLGAQAMAGGSFRRPVATIAWPTAEIGGMGLEGAVRLGFRRELEQAPDEKSRARLFDELVARMYEQGRGVNAAEAFEIDAVIDPVETRAWIRGALDTPRPLDAGHRPVDTW